MIGLHSPSWSRGKLPRSGGRGLALFCPPPGPPKLIALDQLLKIAPMPGYHGVECSLLMENDCEFDGGILPPTHSESKRRGRFSEWATLAEQG